MFMEGELLAHSHIGVYLMKNFPWKEDLDKVFMSSNCLCLVRMTKNSLHRQSITWLLEAWSVIWQAT